MILWRLAEGGLFGSAAPATMAGGSPLGSAPALVALVGLVGMGVIFGISSLRRREEGGDDVREFGRQGNGEAKTPEASGNEAGARPESDLGGVGEHITSVLAAAEAAAANLRAEAEHEARAMLGNAEREGREVLDSARQILAEAEAADSDIRAQADRYAEDRRREADAQAVKTVLEADRKAAAIAGISQERHRIVLSNIATSEARLRDLAKSLRRVADALDTVLGEEPGDGESLEESLHPRTARTAEEGAHP